MTPIRRATERDLPAVLAIVSHTVREMGANGNPQWDATYPTQAVFDADVAGGTLWVAVGSDDQARGFIVADDDEPPAYTSARWRTPGPVRVIHRFALHPAARGRGLARALVAHVEALGRAAGCAAIRVDTHSSNTAMQGLLQACGFAFTGEIDLGKPTPFYAYDKELR